MTADTATLRRLAEAATPGPWHLVKTSPLVNGINNEVGSVVPAVWRATAEYIAACSPDRILSLLDRLAAAESQREAPDVERLVSLMENEGVVTWGDAGHRQRFLAALREQPREPGEER